MTAIEVAFWASVALLFHTHVGYPIVMTLAALVRQRRPRLVPRLAELPSVAVIVAAHDEADVIEAKVRNLLHLDYPRELLTIIVASDGSSDDTVSLARSAAADLVLDLPRQGKISAQNFAVERTDSDIVAFSDANAAWAADALRELVEPFADPDLGYACGRAELTDPAGDNVEGAYWQYELAVRRLESALGGITAGNGAIYAVRREAYLPLPASRSHDLSFPFMLRKRGWRSAYVDGARSMERMVPTLSGELTRKRRMMVGIWDIVIADGMAWPGGYGPLFAFQIASHRLLRYASPLLHVVALGTNIALVGGGAVYAAALGAQLALLAAAALAGAVPSRAFRLCRYYVMVTASIALGLWDRLRQGPPGTWERAEGTR
jgi:cellulose synthase/poly-beta-1,6-N-acetylglucosamine synthase-like glycosyltransferase